MRDPFQGLSIDQATRSLLKYGGELGCSGRVRSSCSTYGTFAIIDGDQNKICNFFLTCLKIEGKICIKMLKHVFVLHIEANPKTVMPNESYWKRFFILELNIDRSFL
jgi:hypothetical protein